MNHTARALTADPLFVGATRPPMRWGVTYTALLANLVLTLEAFLITRNLLTLLIALPVHGVSALLCARDARFFDLALLSARTRLPAWFANRGHWRAVSYSPLPIRAAGARAVREPQSVWAGRGSWELPGC
jgi:type IV secretion system protein VirB3